ncbi:MAG: flagellar export chaperone FlgN [Phycisphaerales bacterium]|jgi:hypothetical protein|nr:flagellar export chaperone FlgN [Phycisphaerales bacterium]
MSRQLDDLESILRQLIEEHRKLLAHMEAQQAAMRSFDLTSLDRITNLQESSRLRIATLETRRRTAVAQVARGLNIAGELSLTRVAQLHPQRMRELMRLRDELKEVIGRISSRNHVAGRLAGSVLGHLNTAVRLLAGAVEQAGLYTKQGVPHVSARIGMMEAVG